jgi:hypothetical protein
MALKATLMGLPFQNYRKKMLIGKYKNVYIADN